MSQINTYKQYPQVRIEIKPTKLINGEVGLYSVRSLVKNAIIVGFKHYSEIKKLTPKQFAGLDRLTKEKILGFCPSGPDGFDVPPDLNYISIAWYMNHSCTPNVGFNDNYDFVTLRNIKKGEELAWDYGYDEHNPKFKMKCVCGSSHCRKVITGNDWKLLMKDTDKYDNFSPKLKKFIYIKK